MRRNLWRVGRVVAGLLAVVAGCAADPTGEEQVQATVGASIESSAAAVPAPDPGTVPLVREVVVSPFGHADVCRCAAADCRCKPLRSGGFECLDSGSAPCECTCEGSASTARSPVDVSAPTVLPAGAPLRRAAPAGVPEAERGGGEPSWKDGPAGSGTP